MTDHPSYPFPIIREVICEIHFRLSAEWDNAIYSEYFKTVEEQFPTFQPVTVVVEFKPNTDGANVLVPQVIRYQHKSRTLVLQLSENRISVNILSAYPGWAQVKKDVEFAWNKLRALIKPVEVSRIGLRYINSIEKGSKSETLGRWIHSTDYIPKAALSSVQGFVCQTSTHLDDYNLMQVIVADQPPSTGSNGMFIIDIDRITENIVGTETESLVAQAQILHDDIWGAFSAAKSEDLEKLLSGELL